MVADMSTITLKDIPPVIHQTLKSRAKAHGRSLNKEILATLETTLQSTRLDAGSLLTRARAVRETNCSAYDCEYVALAEDLQVQLVTSDKAILRDFPARATSPEAFTRERR